MAIALVQKIAASGTSTTPGTTLPATPTPGSLLVAFVACGVATLSAGANGYTKRTEVVTAGTRRGCFYDKIAGASESATQEPCTLGASVVWACHVLEYRGVYQANRLDVENSQADNDTTKTSPAVDPADGRGRLILGAAFSNSGSGTFSGQTIGGSADGVTEQTDIAAGRASSVWDWIGETVAGTYTAETTATSNSEGGAHIAVYRETPAPPPTVRPWRFWTRRRA